MKVLVTGGAGFIGSHIVDAYIKRGHRVSVIDNLFTGKKKNVHPKARFYRGDIKNRKLVNEVMKRERPEIINHEASLASLRVAARRPYELIDSNITGTLNLILATETYPIKKFIFASSCSVLGHPKKLPVKEDEKTNPLSPYAYTKLANEEMIVFYSKWYHFSYVIFRYPNVYGPRQNPRSEAGVIPIFGELIQQNKQPKIFGDGSKTRDYIYVNDVVDAHVRALTRGNNEIMHLGWGKETSDRWIFDEVTRVMGSSVRPVYTPFRPLEALHISLNASKAKRILKWHPVVHLKEGVKRTLDSFK